MTDVNPPCIFCGSSVGLHPASGMNVCDECGRGQIKTADQPHAAGAAATANCPRVEHYARIIAWADQGYDVMAGSITGTPDEPPVFEEYREKARRIVAAEAPVIDGWRDDIENAPKDGQWFIAYENGETYPCQFVSEFDGETHRVGWLDLFNDTIENPTRWRPIEAPALLASRPADDAALLAVVRPEAIDALADYEQADDDGVMVLVSRQAIDECLPLLRALPEIAERMAQMLSERNSAREELAWEKQEVASLRQQLAKERASRPADEALVEMASKAAASALARAEGDEIDPDEHWREADPDERASVVLILTAALSVFRAHDPLLQEAKERLQTVVDDYPVAAGKARGFVCPDEAKGYGSILAAAEFLRKLEGQP